MKHILVALLLTFSFSLSLMQGQAHCDPVYKVMGLFDPALATEHDPAIFSDPLLKDELMSGSFTGKDKEYGDVDGDRDIDILYLTNSNELWVIINAGSVTVPDYRAANKVFTGLTSVISFRLIDWYGDSINDLVVLDDVNSTSKISLYLDLAAQIGSPLASALLLDETQYPINNAQLIEVGDVDGDHFPDILVSGQGTAINGTAYFHLNGTGWNFPPAYDFPQPQTFVMPLIPDQGLSFPTPEFFDADCDGDLDLFISDPWWVFEGGGHVDYYENTGVGSPFLYYTQISPNPYGLDDVPLPGMELTCDWVVTRFVDFFGDGFPEAISYNPCSENTPNGDMFYYRNIINEDTTSAVYTIDIDNITLSPNPVVDELSVQSDDINLQELSVDVIDYVGRLQPSIITLRGADKVTVDVTALSPGIFFLKLMSDGKLVKVVRFVKVG